MGLLSPPEVDTSGREPEVAESIHHARHEVRQQPRSAEAWGRLGLVLLGHDYEVEARICFARADQLDPQDPRWAYLNGRLLKMSDPQTALPFLRRAADSTETNNVPRLYLAETLFGLGHFDEAEATFRRVLADQPQNPRALLGVGRIAFQNGDLAAALDNVRQAERGVPKLRSVHALLAEIYRRQGDAAAEKKELALLSGCEDGDWPDPYLMEIDQHLAGSAGRIARANQLLKKGMPRQAVALLRDAVQMSPGSFRAHFFLGRLLAQQGDLAGGEAQLRAALQIRPESFEAFGELGVVLQRQQKHKEGAEVYRRVLALDPGHPLAHFNLAHCQEKLGDREGALESLRAVVKHKPDFAWAHQVLGRLLAESGQNEAAAEHLNNALRLDPDNSETRNLLQRLTARKKDKC